MSDIHKISMATNQETKLSKRILLAASENGYTLFRNQVGAGWVGRHATVEGGIFIHDARFVKYGLTEGSGDFIGWKSVEVTQDMVGKKIPVFASVEVKTRKGRLSKDQRAWFNHLKKIGAIAIAARSPDDLNDT